MILREFLDGSLRFISSSDLKEYAHKDYLLFKKKAVGETNLLQQIL